MFEWSCYPFNYEPDGPLKISFPVKPSGRLETHVDDNKSKFYTDAKDLILRSSNPNGTYDINAFTDKQEETLDTLTRYGFIERSRKINILFQLKLISNGFGLGSYAISAALIGTIVELHLKDLMALVFKILFEIHPQNIYDYYAKNLKVDIACTYASSTEMKLTPIGEKLLNELNQYPDEISDIIEDYMDQSPLVQNKINFEKFEYYSIGSGSEKILAERDIKFVNIDAPDICNNDSTKKLHKRPRGNPGLPVEEIYKRLDTLKKYNEFKNAGKNPSLARQKVGDISQEQLKQFRDTKNSFKIHMEQNDSLFVEVCDLARNYGHDPQKWLKEIFTTIHVQS